MKKTAIYWGMTMLIFAAVGCSKSPKKEVTPAPNPIIRLSYFWGENPGGDPAAGPGPHQVRQSVSADGINFTSEETIFSYGNLVEPDLFQIPGGQYGLLVSQYNTAGVTLATASSPSGPFTVSGAMTPATGIEQTATFLYNDTLRSLSNGISISDMNPTTLTFNKTKLCLDGSQIDAQKLVSTSPTITNMPNGKYLLAFERAIDGSEPSEREIWIDTSSNPKHFVPTSATLFHNAAAFPGITLVGSTLYLYFVNGQATSQQSSLEVAISNDSGASWKISQVQLNGKPIQNSYDPTAMPITAPAAL